MLQVVLDTSGCTHAVCGYDDSGTRPFINGYGFSCGGCEVEIGHIEGVVALIQYCLGLFIVIFLVFSENFRGLDGEGAVEIDRQIGKETFSVKFAQYIDNFLGPLHGKGGYDNFLPVRYAVSDGLQ